ncbi:MAG: hypothetical protein DRP45_02195 [Candidatus Zixiibacteriota bacterium]|nr:MAG: hypothetical protein DRP45_02195 [candidate division Zixibacteria bacterium]
MRVTFIERPFPVVDQEWNRCSWQRGWEAKVSKKRRFLSTTCTLFPEKPPWLTKRSSRCRCLSLLRQVSRKCTCTSRIVTAKA